MLSSGFCPDKCLYSPSSPVSVPFHVLFSAPWRFLLLYVLIQHLLKIFHMLDVIRDLEAQRHNPYLHGPPGGGGQRHAEHQGSQAWDTEAYQGRTRESIGELARALWEFNKYLFKVCVYTCVVSTSVCTCVCDPTSVSEDMVVMGQGGEGWFLGLLTM